MYRNIADLDAIISYAEKDEVKRAVIVGGGLLGLEAAKAVYDLPTWVSDVSYSQSLDVTSIFPFKAYPR